MKDMKLIPSDKTVTNIKSGNPIKNDQVSNREETTKNDQVSNREETTKNSSDFFISIFLKSLGINPENSLILIITVIIKFILVTIKNSGAFLIGEQETGKSSLYSIFLSDICKKISGNITLANLRGDARKSDNTKCLLEENVVIFEEMMNISNLREDVIGFLKDSIESKTFLKKSESSTITNTSFIFIGNDYSNFNKFNDINKAQLFKTFPKEFNDKAFFDRIPFLLPHYHSLFGKIKYLSENEYIFPITYIEEIVNNLREKEVKFILKDFENTLSKRELRIFNKVIFSLFQLFFQENTTYQNFSWFIEGWVEFLKYFRGLLTDKFHNPFNKNSVKLILYLLNYNLDEIEYVAFDNQDRLIIKLLNKDFFHKIALTGFGCENNRIEIEYFKKNKCPSILPIISLEKNDTLLIQESGEYLPDERIYFNKILELNNSYNKTDPEYNNFVLEKIAKGENNYSFRGIPDFYKKSLLLKVKNIFKKDISEIELKDFSFEKEQIRIINFHNYLKN